MHRFRSEQNSSSLNGKYHDFYGNRKPPFAHSTANPIHPDYNATVVKLSNDSRSQMHQRVRIIHEDESFSNSKEIVSDEIFSITSSTKIITLCQLYRL